MTARRLGRLFRWRRGPETHFAAGTSPAGLTIDPAGLDAELPRPELAGEADGLRFTRLSDRLWEEGSSVFLSEEVAVVADLRAARAYERTGRENDPLVPGHCVRCDRAALAIDLEARELLAGDDVRVTFEGALGQRLTDLYGPARLATSELALPSVRWETAPSLRQEPTLGPSLGGGEVVPGTLLHSGEFRHDATDLYVPGRGLDFAFTRVNRREKLAPQQASRFDPLPLAAVGAVGTVGNASSSVFQGVAGNAERFPQLRQFP